VVASIHICKACSLTAVSLRMQLFGCPTRQTLAATHGRYHLQRHFQQAPHASHLLLIILPSFAWYGLGRLSQRLSRACFMRSWGCGRCLRHIPTKMRALLLVHGSCSHLHAAAASPLQTPYHIPICCHPLPLSELECMLSSGGHVCTLRGTLLR
jgi:hypothetical protein